MTKKFIILLNLILFYLATSATTIAIIELEGVPLEHPSLENKVYGHNLPYDVRVLWHEQSNEREWDKKQNLYKHGTWMSGAILRYNPNVLIKSINRIIGPDESTNPNDATDWDGTDECEIINIAFGATTYNTEEAKWKWDGYKIVNLRKTLAQKYKAGKLIVIAAGNECQNAQIEPGAYPEFLTVASVEPYNDRFYWWGNDQIEVTNNFGEIFYAIYGSNYHSNVDISAPAGKNLIKNIPSWEPTRNEQNISEIYFPSISFGATSGASAIVSAYAAELLENYPFLDPSDLEQILKNTAVDCEDPGYDIKTGWGVVNIDNALEYCNHYMIEKRYVTITSDKINSIDQSDATLFLNGGEGYLTKKYDVEALCDLTDIYGINMACIWGSSHFYYYGNKLPSEGLRNSTVQYEIPHPTVSWDSSNGNVFNISATYFHDFDGNWLPRYIIGARLGYTVVIAKVPPSNVKLCGRAIDPSVKATGYFPSLYTDLTYGTLKDLHYTYQNKKDYNDNFIDVYETSSKTYLRESALEQDGEYFRVKVNDRRVTGINVYSNAFYLRPPVAGDPIVQYSDRNDATGYANSRKIVVDSLENIYVVYTKNDSVFCTKSSDNGESWQTNDFIGLGDKPAINLLSNSTPVICWAQDNRIYKTKRSNMNWDNKETIYTAPSGTIEFLCFETDAFDQSYLGWVENGASGSSVKISEYNPNSTGATLAPTPIDDGPQNAFKCPSISFKPDGDISVTWSRNGSVYYYDLNGIEQINDIGSIGEHPIVSAYGDKISVIWKDETIEGKQRIIKRVKRNDEWEETQIIRENDDKELNYPYVVNGSQYLYCEENTDGDKDVIHLGEFSGGWLTEYQNISYNSGGNSYHPSAYYKQNWPKGKLYILWTEEMEEDIPTDAVSTVNPVKIYVKDDIEPIEYLYCDCGTPEGDYYNIQKQDTIFYDNLPEHTIDYDNNRLAYKFSSINPGRRYKIRFKFYQNSGNTIMQKISIDGRTNKVKKVFTDQITELYEWLPASCIKDGEILIDISKMAGPYAVCSEISLFEFEKNVDDEEQEDTKQQQIKHYTSNLTASGNMLSFSNEYSTKYTVDVFNTLGQKVISLPEQIYTAGYHEINIDRGNKLSNGIYFIQISNETEVNSVKMTIIK